MRLYAILVYAPCLAAQQSPLDVHLQATTITQTHRPFDRGPSGRRQTDTSFTATAFIDYRHGNTEVGFYPEVAGGAGFRGVLGMGGFTNGENPTVGETSTAAYIGRFFLSQKFSRFTSTFGRIASSDFFDGNAFSHDPRTQFQNWSLMYNAAWDYPADTRNYTLGAIQEAGIRRSVFRAGAFVEPLQPDALPSEHRRAFNYSEAFEWQHSYTEEGTFRILAFLSQARAPDYRQTAEEKQVPRTLKYGLGLSVEHRFLPGIGVFARLGWNDGRSQSWTSTEIDRTAAAGVSLAGMGWKRAQDALGIGVAANGISGDHSSHLASCGYGFVTGDGRLEKPGRERGPGNLLRVAVGQAPHRIARLSTHRTSRLRPGAPGSPRRRHPFSYGALTGSRALLRKRINCISRDRRAPVSDYAYHSFAASNVSRLRPAADAAGCRAAGRCGKTKRLRPRRRPSRPPIPESCRLAAGCSPR